jgi:hypothetical protein
MLSYGSVEALIKHCCGFIQALLRRGEGAVKALLYVYMSYPGFIQALLTRYYIQYLYVCVKSVYVSLREDTRCLGRLCGRVRLAVFSLGRIEALLRRFGGAIKYMYTLLCV